MMTFAAFTHQWIQELNRSGKFLVADNREVTLRSFLQFLDRDDLSFDEIDEELVKKYESWLYDRGLKHSTVVFYLAQLCTIFRQAVKEGETVRRNPFRLVNKATVPKQNRTLLTREELQRLRHFDFTGISASQSYARDMFFFSIYAHGMSFTDIAFLKKSDLKDGMLTYISHTWGNPTRTVCWDPQMQEIAARYPSETSYIFPFVTTRSRKEALRKVIQQRQNVTRNLKKIAVRCNLSVVPTFLMTRDLYIQLVQQASVSDLI
jgi:site-specific recombinase XerD